MPVSQTTDAVKIHFQGEALSGGCESDDDLALMTEIRHDPFDACEYPALDAHQLSNGDGRMGPQQASTGQALADSCHFNCTYGVAHTVAQ